MVREERVLLHLQRAALLGSLWSLSCSLMGPVLLELLGFQKKLGSPLYVKFSWQLSKKI